MRPSASSQREKNVTAWPYSRSVLGYGLRRVDGAGNDPLQILQSSGHGC